MPRHIKQTIIRTPSSRISTRDIKEMYSCMILCLDLKRTPKPQKPTGLLHLPLKKKQYPYSFTTARALETLQQMSVKIANTIITKTNSKSVAEELLQLFFNAKLLHCPEVKTRNKFVSSDTLALLQPTPKGIAVLSKFCQRLSDNSKPPILDTSFNSMDLICFERNSATDRIIHNEYWDKLLFLKVMGPTMNVWDPSNPSDEISTKHSQKAIHTNREEPFDGSRINYALESPKDSKVQFLEYMRQREQGPLNDIPTSDPAQQLDKQSADISNPEECPFHHRYFTNPDSDSHVQYYISGKGVRLFKDRLVRGSLVPYYVTSKAILQYLMDCTDLMYIDEGVKIAQEFVKHGLISHLDGTLPEVLRPDKDPMILTKAGREIVRWKNASKLSSKHIPVAEETSLNTILHDPGLKYLFREHLTKNYSVENLEAYEAIGEFQRKRATLRKLASRHARGYQDSTSERHRFSQAVSAIEKLSKDCFAKAFDIYTLYIATGASNELNIDYQLRAQIIKRMARSMVSPTESTPPSQQEEISEEELREISVLYNKVRKEIFEMMSKDSFWFLQSIGRYR